MLRYLRQFFVRRAAQSCEGEISATQEQERLVAQEQYLCWAKEHAEWMEAVSKLTVLTPSEVARWLRIDEARLNEARIYGLRAIDVAGEVRFRRESLERFLAGRPPSYYELPDLLTLGEAAYYLRLPVAVLQAEVEAGRFPACTIAGQLRIESNELRKLPTYQYEPLPPPQPATQTLLTQTAPEPTIHRCASEVRSEPSEVPPPSQNLNPPVEEHSPEFPDDEVLDDEFFDNPAPDERFPTSSASPLWNRILRGEALPCRRCAYHALDRWLPCAVRPSGPDGSECYDFLPKVEGRNCA